MEIKRNVLLNPGPATTSDTVKMAQVVPDICPREKEFGSVMEFISKELTNFVGSNDKYTTILFGGSGTAAVEAMISSVVDYNECMLIINNGAYGKRMCEMADIYGINYTEYKASPIEGIDLYDLEENIKNSDKNIKKLAVVHHETTTGILNDIRAVGEICSRYDIDMIVDAMSSFAGIPINMKEMNIKYMASSSNKCIQGMAGVSFVISDKESLKNTEKIKPRNLYLNLYKQYEYFKDNYQMRFTPPVQVLYALNQAIIEAKNETIEKRNDRYIKCCEELWKGLDKIGLKRLLKDEKQSKLLTTVVEPEIKEYSFNDLHNYLYERGFTIYPGKLAAGNTFRIANIGEIMPKDIKEFIKVLQDYFLKI